MIKVTLKDPAEANELLSAADYEKFVAEEGGTKTHLLSMRSRTELTSFNVRASHFDVSSFVPRVGCTTRA